MIKIRKNCFETNSSSTHSLIIANAERIDKKTLPSYINIELGDFGWEWAKYTDYISKISYMYSLANYLDSVEYFVETVSEWFKEDNISCDFEDPAKHEYSGYVDHGDYIADFFDNIMKNKELFYQFIFSSKSFILTGNDNSYSNLSIGDIPYPYIEIYKGN